MRSRPSSATWISTRVGRWSTISRSKAVDVRHAGCSVRKGIQADRHSYSVGLYRLLLPGRLDDALGDVEAPALAHLVHVPLRHVLPLAFVAQVLQLLLRPRHPERIQVEELKPAKPSCGLAAPNVRLRISSAKPNDSTTGSIDPTVQQEVPSLIYSEVIRPLLRASTPCTLPSTSTVEANSRKCQLVVVLACGEPNSLDA